MLSFEEIINRGVRNWKDKNADKEADNLHCLRGSNTPLIYDGKFIADSSSHCPRIAAVRKLGLPTDYPKTFKDLASHAYGRAMEALLKELIEFAEVEGLVTVEEEQFKVQVTNDNNEVIYSARPDLILCWNSIPSEACEFKSVQSAGTADSVFFYKEPKLGACIQAAAQMHFHGLDKGTICYISGAWVEGYSFPRKAKFKYDPMFKCFNLKFDEEGWLLVDERKSLVNKNNLEGGISLLTQYLEAGQLPEERPRSLKTFGAAAYNVCEYCTFGAQKTGICDRAEGISEGLSVESFSELVKEVLVIK